LIRILHRDLYCIGLNLPKREKLGIHKNIEDFSLEMLSLAIEAAFQFKTEKTATLKRLRIITGVLQNIIRTENELKIIDDKTYLKISEQIIGISKQNNNWLSSLITQKEVF
jgi:hypothetical protein